MSWRPRLVAVCVLLAAAGCRDSAESPAWLAEQIAAIASEPLTNPPSQFFRYRYRGEVVYYRPPRCCDIQGELYAADGVTLCFPGGGISGRGDGRCEDFYVERSDCRLVWSDPRAKPGTLPDCGVARSRPPQM